MTPAERLGALQRRGVVVVPASDGRLRYRPQAALSDADRAALDRDRVAILALLLADPVGWRVAVVRPQVPARGALPFLVARPGLAFACGTCGSCGDPLGPNERYRCRPCIVAITAALETPPAAPAKPA